MGILCQDEIEALIIALFILPTMLMFGGSSKIAFISDRYIYVTN